jgi:hypothetical protein
VPFRFRGYLGSQLAYTFSKEVNAVESFISGMQVVWYLLTVGSLVFLSAEAEFEAMRPR